MSLQIVSKKKSDIELTYNNSQYLVNIELYFKTTDIKNAKLVINDTTLDCSTISKRDDKRKCFCLKLDLFSLDSYPIQLELNSNDASINLFQNKQVRIKYPEVRHAQMLQIQDQVDIISEMIVTLESNNNDEIMDKTALKIEEIDAALLDIRLLLQNKTDITHNHELLDIEGLTDMFGLKAPLAHEHKVVDIPGIGDYIDEKIMLLLKFENIKGIEEQVTQSIDERISKLLDVKKFNTMESIIGNNNYLHVGKVEIFQQDNDPRKTVLWVKILSNLMFENPTDVTNATKIENKQKIDINTIDQGLSNNIEINTIDQLNCDSIGLSYKSQVPLDFIQCIIIPQGPKNMQDYPIGNKSYEWLESEIHMQFTTTADLSKMSLNEKKIDVMYKDIKMTSTYFKIHDQIDWQHYYINYMNHLSK